MNSPVFYDTHCHLDYPDFEADFPAILQRAQQAGIQKIISIGTDLASSRKALQLAERHPNLYATVGWHPCHASEAPGDFRAELREMAQHPKVVAIGETGLDFARPPETEQEISRWKEKQAAVFEQQLEVAAELGLNVVVHQREAMDDVLSVLPKYPTVQAVFHCFVGNPGMLQKVISAGHLVSFTGIVTFKNAEEVRASVREVPPESFMLETDAPFLAPVPFRGKRGEPAYVRQIAETIASVRQISLDEVSRATCATAERFFKKLNGSN
jgi:TatD DNase family protein